MNNNFFQSSLTRILSGLCIVTALLACNTVTTALGGTPVPTLPPPTPTYTPGTFAGYYVNGFEVSSFVPCDLATTNPGYAQGYWFAGNQDFFKQYEQVVAASNIKPGEEGYGQVFIRFDGELSAPGDYGHLNGYAREINLINLIEMSLVEDGQCEGS